MSETAARLTAELVADSAVPRDPVISPDGRAIAYEVTTVGVKDGRTGALWLVAADASSPPVRLTPGATWDHRPRWAPDSSSLLFLSGGQVHRIRFPADVTAEALTGWRGEIADFLPLADGRRVAVIAGPKPSPEDERRRAERDDAIVWDGGRSRANRLWLLDLPSGALTPAAGLEGRHITEVAQRPDGGPLAVISWDCPDDDPGARTARLHVLDPDTGTALDLGPAGPGASSPSWWRVGKQWPDGEHRHDRERWHLSYLAVAPPRLVGGMAVFDVTVLAGDAPTEAEHRNLTEGMTVCPAELVQTGDGPPLALFADRLDTTLYRLDPSSKRFECLARWPGEVGRLSASRSGDRVTALASTAYQPADVHAGPPAGQLIRLSNTAPELNDITWGTQERLSYAARDGLDLDGLLILPPGRTREDGPFPLVTLVHGGPDERYADALMLGWWPSGQWLATAGFAVFLPNPRGSTGRGHQFADTVAGALGQDEWTDILAGIDLLVDGGVADPDRLGIGGWSHGGFMAAWAVTQTTRFKAALMGAGIADWGMQAGVGELGMQEADLCGSSGWAGVGPHRHNQLSPISYASRVRTPVLIVHGEDDTNVPVGQAVYFHRALAHFGVEHELVIYPREGHPITERNHQIDLLNRIRAWFTRWLTSSQ
jgi:dipeptidyl aminopeptidase/acylaminoacyl peptidase